MSVNSFPHISKEGFSDKGNKCYFYEYKNQILCDIFSFY